MTHLQPLADADAPPAAQKLFTAIQGKFRMVPNIFRSMGHAPAVLEHTLGLNEAIHQDLDPRLRELAYLTASRINGCDYCAHYHTGAAKKAGLSSEQIEGLGGSPGTGPYSDLEKLVIRFADEWTRKGKASAEVVQALAARLSPAQLVTLAAVVGLANWTNRFNETFDVQLP